MEVIINKSYDAEGNICTSDDDDENNCSSDCGSFNNGYTCSEG